MAWDNRRKQHNACKKDISKELMTVASHPRKWWDWCQCLLTEPIFTNKN